MIDALIAGRIYGAPVARTTKGSRPYATCKVRVSTANGKAIFVSVVAFSAPTVTALLALSDGDSAALAGTLTADCLRRQGRQPAPLARPGSGAGAHRVSRRAQAQGGTRGRFAAAVRR
jgi:hypothetical protein